MKAWHTFMLLQWLCVCERETESKRERQREYSHNLNSRCLYVKKKKKSFTQPVSREVGAAAMLRHAASEENSLYHACFAVYHIWAFALADTGQPNRKELVCEVLFCNSEVSLKLGKEPSVWLSLWPYRRSNSHLQNRAQSSSREVLVIALMLSPEDPFLVWPLPLCSFMSS